MNMGDAAPEFALPDLTGRLHRLQDYRGRIVILNFWSCECPHAVRTDQLLQSWLVSWGEDVALLPIASNLNESHEDLEAAASQRKMPLVLVDQEHSVADLYQAQTTPHVYLIDPLGMVRYSGAVDDVNFSRRQPSRFFLLEAVQGLRDGVVDSIPPTQPYGCAIVRHALE